MSKSKRVGRAADRWGEALKSGADEFYTGHGKDKVFIYLSPLPVMQTVYRRAVFLKENLFL